jgi:hypothetical protein
LQRTKIREHKEDEIYLQQAFTIEGNE